MMDAGSFNLDDFVSHRRKLEDVNDAISRMRSGESIHTMITFKSAPAFQPYSSISFFKLNFKYSMIIGIDFDNTIVCHDDSFRNLAQSEGFLPESDENPKETLKRGFLRQNATNVLWTETQAEVYGKRLSSAKVFDGFPSFLSKAVSLGHKVLVISHRTIYPALGGCMNLHDAAKAWLLENSLMSHKRILQENCFFETTLEEKVARIGIENCDLFIDDLASVLEHPGFPKQAKGIFFGKKHDSLLHLPSWKDADWLFDLPVKSTFQNPPLNPSSELHEDSFRKILDIPPTRNPFGNDQRRRKQPFL